MSRSIYRAILTTLMGLSLVTQADPYTKILLGKDVDNLSIYKYYKRHHIQDKESLVVIGSHYIDSDMPIAGTGFTVQSEGQKFIITNSHLVDGDNKFFIYRGELHPIEENKTLSCANHDIAIIEVNNTIQETFGIYNSKNNSLYTHGMNNSPRSLIKDEFTFGEKKSTNYNNRPLFENLKTGETLSYVQIGNMYDLSCNFYPSSPEPYKGNALFVPISEAIKAITTEPIPYKQNHHNQIGTMNSIMDLISHNKCTINLDSKEKDHEKSRQSFISRSIITPSSIVPGMSGSPLLQNNDLNQSKYEIVGIATSYDRIMQKSIFSSHSNIKECLNNYIQGKRGHLDNVRFKYSKDYQSTYRQKSSQNLIEEIPNSHGKANGDLTDSQIKELYDLYLTKKEIKIDNDNKFNLKTIEVIRSFKNDSKDQTIIRGGNGYGNGGGPITTSSINFRERINIPTGMAINKKLVIGFKCKGQADKKAHDYIFANWEGLSYSEINQCEEIDKNDSIDLISLLKKRLKSSKSSNKTENTEETFSIRSSLKIKKDTILLTIKGKYLKNKFRKTVKINNALQDFSPRLEIRLDDQYSIIADIKELFFTDMLSISRRSRNQRLADAIHRDSKARVFYSLKKSDSTKGSIPLINTWD
ncbi:hypothetical protein ABMA77_14010 [Halobacteriovorax sp. RZ-1]|uniref:hypothetical protein n=1 Tax=unclassified Halobacteriovorax TaxID=2639665 RepID=UPI0037137005